MNDEQKYKALARRNERRKKHYLRALIEIRDNLDELADRIDTILNNHKDGTTVNH